MRLKFFLDQKSTSSRRETTSLLDPTSSVNDPPSRLNQIAQFVRQGIFGVGDGIWSVSTLALFILAGTSIANSFALFMGLAAVGILAQILLNTLPLYWKFAGLAPKMGFAISKGLFDAFLMMAYHVGFISDIYVLIEEVSLGACATVMVGIPAFVGLAIGATALAAGHFYDSYKEHMNTRSNRFGNFVRRDFANMTNTTSTWNAFVGFVQTLILGFAPTLCLAMRLTRVLLGLAVGAIRLIFEHRGSEKAREIFDTITDWILAVTNLASIINQGLTDNVLNYFSIVFAAMLPVNLAATLGINHMVIQQAENTNIPHTSALNV